MKHTEFKDTELPKITKYNKKCAGNGFVKPMFFFNFEPGCIHILQITATSSLSFVCFSLK